VMMIYSVFGTIHSVGDRKGIQPVEIPRNSLLGTHPTTTKMGQVVRNEELYFFICVLLYDLHVK